MYVGTYAPAVLLDIIGARNGDLLMSFIAGLYEKSLGAVDCTRFWSPFMCLLPDRLAWVDDINEFLLLLCSLLFTHCD